MFLLYFLILCVLHSESQFLFFQTRLHTMNHTTDPELIYEKWDNLVDIVIDGGYGGNEGSTIVDLSQDNPLIIREGKGSMEIF